MMHPAHPLLLENVLESQPRQAATRILISEGGDGWLAREIATQLPQSEILTLARDSRDVRAAQTKLAGLPNANATEDVLAAQESAGTWDIVLLTTPKGRRYARVLLLAAWSALRPGGHLLVAGPSKGGAKAVITDAERLFGNSVGRGYRNHQRVALSIRPDVVELVLPKAFTEPGVAPNTEQFVEIERPQGSLSLLSHPGVFSWKHLDPGTELLLKHMHIQTGERVWDVGCGIGILGLAAAMAGAGAVAMSDVNLLAAQYARQNVVRNGFEAIITVFAKDGIAQNPLEEPTGQQWDLIVSNPAFHQEEKVDTSMPDAMIQQAPSVLASQGRLLLVANRFLNYDKQMRKVFSSVEIVASTRSYHVIEGRV
ncbi:MAG: methyltransferase [Chloroflexota bacterium]